MVKCGGLPRYFYYFFLKERLSGFKQSLTRKPSGCLSLAILLGSVLGSSLASAVQAVPLQADGAEVTPAASEIAPLLEDGVYFYGEAPIPDEVGHSYLIFAAQGQRVVGAVYMPSSSFDCFQGEMTTAALTLEITNSYTQEVYDYAIATAPSDSIASASGGPLASLGLSGFYELGEIRAADLALLQICQSDLQGEAELEI